MEYLFILVLNFTVVPVIIDDESTIRGTTALVEQVLEEVVVDRMEVKYELLLSALPRVGV